jgi:hypothetical protein
VQYPTIKALALIDLGRFGEAWQSLEEEIADEAHRFGAALRDFGKLHFEIAVGAYDAAFDRAPHVISESKVLARAWMLNVTAGFLANIAPIFAGDQNAIARIEALIATTGATPGTNGEAALAFAKGDLSRAREGLVTSATLRVAGFAGRISLFRLQLLASVHAAEERWTEAREGILAAVALARPQHIKGVLWQLLGELALIERKLGLSEASRSHAEAKSILSEISQTIPDPQHRSCLLRGRVATRLGLAVG